MQIILEADLIKKNIYIYKQPISKQQKKTRTNWPINQLNKQTNSLPTDQVIN